MPEVGVCPYGKAANQVTVLIYKSKSAGRRILCRPGLSGHSSMKMAERYAYLTPKNQRATAAVGNVA